jgi:hypothetical protein
LTFAGRYPPETPVKRERFLAEREWWINWRQGIQEGGYRVCDCQANFYQFMRQKIALDANDYDQRIGDIIQRWKNAALSSSVVP